MNNLNTQQYGKYIVFSSFHGSFDPFEFPKFLQETEDSGADIAFCGTIRLLPDGSLSRSYFTDQNLNLSGEEAYELILNERWIPPRFFGMIILNSFYNEVVDTKEAEENQVLMLVRSAKSVFVYGNYANYLESRYDITSIHCLEPSWLFENLSKTAFMQPFMRLPKQTKCPRVWILGTPEHGNLGDQAIVYAMHNFVKCTLPDIKMYEITERQLEEQLDDLLLSVGPRDIILLVGGGNLGDLYLGPQKARRIIIKNFPNNRMILFPQSVYFQDPNSIKGEAILLSSHSNLTLCAREKGSFDYMKKYFTYNQILLTPDIVLSLSIKYKDTKRNGAIALIRLDKESILTQSDLYDLKALLTKKFKSVTFGDTIVRHPCRDREEEINKKLQQIRSAELVITDRLHGAIFAAISNTPCIILPNHYHKVEGMYEWLKRMPYIRFCQDFSQLSTIMDDLLAVTFPEVTYNLFNQDFIELETLLKGSEYK